MNNQSQSTTDVASHTPNLLDGFRTRQGRPLIPGGIRP